MAIYIGSARHDERGKYVGGKRGDQTGTEVATQAMYNHNWVAYRAKSSKVAVGLKNSMLRACSNNNIGYSQSDRYSIWGKGTGTKTLVNTDCSMLVRVCIKEASGKDIGDFTTASEHAALLNSGLFTKVGNVTKNSELFEGDILVTKTKGHTAIVTSGKSYPVVTHLSGPTLVAQGQQHAINFTGVQIGVDGVVGPETRKQAVRVVQNALNLDYGAGLELDGEWGKDTNSAFGSHYVERKETQYLVTAAEILCMLNNKDPKGVECPGKFGAGLEAAAGARRLNADWFKNHVNL
jgi:hypothetical protein